MLGNQLLPLCRESYTQKQLAKSVWKELFARSNSEDIPSRNKKMYVWQKYKQNDKRIRMWKRLNIIL